MESSEVTRDLIETVADIDSGIISDLGELTDNLSVAELEAITADPINQDIATLLAESVARENCTSTTHARVSELLGA